MRLVQVGRVGTGLRLVVPAGSLKPLARGLWWGYPTGVASRLPKSLGHPQGNTIVIVGRVEQFGANRIREGDNAV